MGKCLLKIQLINLLKQVFMVKDHLQGVSSNIMLGQLINAGTGMCDILLDEEKLVSEMSDINQTVDDFIEVTENNIESLIEGDDDELDDYCNDENFKLLSNK